MNCDNHLFQRISATGNTRYACGLPCPLSAIYRQDGGIWSGFRLASHARAMGEGLFELRLKAGEGIARVFYCTMAGNKIMVLHQFIKKTDKTPPRELETTRRSMKEAKDAHTQRT